MAAIEEQHYQLPRRKIDDSITPREQLIYLAIKYFDNPEHKTYPSLAKISKLVGLSIPTIRKSIQQLVDLKYLEIKKEGKRQYYTFNEYKKFEAFSKEFMESNSISPTTKSYLAAVQEYMKREDMENGNISWSNRELSERINMPESTISNCNRELVKLNLMDLLQSQVRDRITGCPKQIKVFHLREFGQAVAFKFIEVDNRLNEHDNEIKTINERLDKMEESNKQKDLIIKQKDMEIKAKDKQLEIYRRQLEARNKEMTTVELT